MIRVIILIWLFTGEASFAATNSNFLQQVSIKKQFYKRYQNDALAKNHISLEYSSLSNRIKSLEAPLKDNQKHLNRINRELSKLGDARDLEKLSKEIMEKVYLIDRDELKVKVDKQVLEVSRMQEEMVVLEVVWREMFIDR